MGRILIALKRFLDLILIPFFFLIVLLGIYRIGPFFCAAGLPCIEVQRDTFFLGYFFSIPTATFYEVLAFWATVVGLLNLVLTFNKRGIPDFILGGPDQLKFNKSRHYVEVPHEALPFPIKFAFLVKNNGNLSIQPQSFDYTIFLPNEIQVIESEISSPVLNENGLQLIPRLLKKVEGRPGVQTLGGEMSTKVYPSRSKKLFTVNLKFPSAGLYNIEYYFVTDNDLLPSGMKFDKNNEPIKNLGKIVIEVK